MQPIINEFAMYSFMSDRQHRQWCCLSNILAYYHIESLEFFLMSFPIVIAEHESGAITTLSQLEMSVDRGDTFELRDAAWITQNIEFYDPKHVFIEASWTQTVVNYFYLQVQSHYLRIWKVVTESGFYAMRSSRRSFQNPHHMLVSEYLNHEPGFSAQLVTAKNMAGEEIESAWIYWNNTLYDEPKVVVLIDSLPSSHIRVQGNGRICYCLRRI